MKQLIYFLFYALCWGTVIGGIYFVFLKPAPSCFDHKQNQGEQGVDCGGPCAQACIPQDLKSISVVDRVVFLPTAQAHYIVFAEVKNENVGFAARNFDYTFNLYDNGGSLVGSASGHTYAYAGDVRYLFEPDIYVSGGTSPAKASLEISNIDWVSPGNFIRPRLRVQHFETSQAGNNYDVEGSVVNEDAIPLNKVVVVAIFRGNLGQFAGASQTELDTVQPNETRPFTVLYPATVSLDPLGTQVFVSAYRQ